MQMLKDSQELIDLADRKFQEGEYSEAEMHYLEALGIREYALGSQSVLVYDVLEKLEKTYLADERFEDADRMRRRMDSPPIAA